MPYATQTDLLQRMTLRELTQLTDDANAGQPDPGVVGGVLEEASGKVDGYCRSRYQTPLQASDEVTAIARDIAVYLLWSRRPMQMSETVRQRYEDAMKLLSDVSAGKAALDQPVSAVAAQEVLGGPVPERTHLRMTGHNLEGFV